MAVLGLASMLALTFGTISDAGAKQGRKSGKPAVKLMIKTSSQDKLANGRARVKVKATRPARPRKQTVKLIARLKLGQKSIKKAGRVRVKLKRGKNRKVTIRLNGNAKRLARKCGRPKLTVVSETKVVKRARRSGKNKRRVNWRRSGKARRKLSQDPGRCGRGGPEVVPVPSTIDLSTADRCDFITESAEPRTLCLFPYPNDYFTRKDATTETGLRLDLDPESTPENAKGKHIDPADFNKSDGWSPGAPIVTQVPGMDTIQAFQASDIVPITQKSKYAAPDQPIVLIDAATGQREPIWAELDANATSPEQTDLLIHFNRNLLEGHRYIVAMRNLKRADGSLIEAPDGFKLYRTENQVTENELIESRRAHFEEIFKVLADAGISRDDLYMAWDFTVSSGRNLTERMLDIRDDAFAQLGDTNLADGIPQGDAPQFTVDPAKSTMNYGIPFNPADPPGPAGHHERGEQNIRTVAGTFEVPCYLEIAGVPDPAPGNPDGYPNGCPSGATFKLNSDGLPVRTPGATFTARFICNIPRSSIQDNGSGEPDVVNPSRPSLYGHGLFGDYYELNRATNVRQLGDENGVMVCGTDWSGMAEDDVFPTAISALQDMSKFSAIPDRQQQGFLNFLYLGRLMHTSAAQGGFVSDPAFQDADGDPLFDPSSLFYYGNSQGGIAGGALTAIAPDFTRSVLYVPGFRYSELLTRSIDFEYYSVVLYPSYPVERTRPLLLSMIQTLWDRGEPSGYAQHMTDDPLPNTPAHKVLIEMAYGDHQVANVTTEAEARTIGAPLRRPALDESRLQPGLIEPWYEMGTLGDLGGPAADGSGMFVWDIGNKRMVGPDELGTDPAPLTNTWPDDSFGVDPHDTVIEQSPLARKHIADFIKVDGKITNPAEPACGSHPCYAAGYKGAP
jgi:hypothetical protein